MPQPAIRVLISAFEPFGGRSNNTSADLLRLLSSRSISQSIEVTRVLLPVDFERAWPRLSARIAKVDPDLVLMTGEGKSSLITWELAAHNQRRHSPAPAMIDTQAPGTLETRISAKYITTLPTYEEAAFSVESHPGDYLCNFVYFQCLQYYGHKHSLFAHVRPMATAEFSQHASQVVCHIRDFLNWYALHIAHRDSTKAIDGAAAN